MVVSSGFGPSLPDDMGVHRTLLAGSLRSSGGSDKDSSQKLTDLFAIVNTFPWSARLLVIRLGMSNTQNISPKIAQNNSPNHTQLLPVITHNPVGYRTCCFFVIRWK